MNMIMYKGELVDADTFHPPFAPAGMTLAQCRAIDKRVHDGDVEFAKAMLKQLEK